jgi:hypothetical protein
MRGAGPRSVRGPVAPRTIDADALFAEHVRRYGR